MSTLLTLFKASKKLYQDFEDSRLGTNIPLVRSHKAFKLNDSHLPEPKEDNAIEEFIQKLALDTDVKNSTHLKNLVTILQLCTIKTDTASLQTSLTALRDENKILFGAQTFHADYVQAIEDFISHKVLLENLATLRAEMAAKDAANALAMQTLTEERDRLQTEKNQTVAVLIETSAKLNQETRHNSQLIEQCEQQDKIMLDLKKTSQKDLETFGVNIDRRDDKILELNNKKIQLEITLAALRQEIETLKETIENLEGKESDLYNSYVTARYGLAETAQKLEVEGKSHSETDSRLKSSELAVVSLDKRISDLQTQLKTKNDNITVLEQTIQMHLGVNAELKDTHAQTIHAHARQLAELKGIHDQLLQTHAAQLAELKKLLDATLQTQLSELEDKNAQLVQAHAAQMTELTAQADERYKILSVQLTELGTKLDEINVKAKQNFQQSELKLREHETKAREANARSAEIQRLLDRTKLEKATLQTKSDELIAEHKKITDSLTLQIKEVSDAKKQLEAKSKVNATQASAELKSLSKDYMELERAKKQVETDLSALKGQLEKANAGTAAATQKVKDMQQTINALKLKLAESDALRIELEEDNLGLKESFDATLLANDFSSGSSVDTVRPATAAKNDSKGPGSVTGTSQTMFSARKAAVKKQQSNQPAATPQPARQLSN